MTSPEPPAPRKKIRYEPSTFRTVRIRAKGQAFELGGDMYFALVTRPLWQFGLAVAGLVLAINTLFAVAYLFDPGGISNARPGSFEDAFFFSVQTLATIGYGTMAPQTRFAHVVVTIESILGVIAVGSLAGIAFARLSRPRARVLFSNKLVVRPRDGVPHLQLRVANWRTNIVVEASLRVFLLTPHRTAEGEVTRTPIEIPLLRSSTPFFFLSWTPMHKIDEQSPFHDRAALGRLRADGAQLFVMLTGYDLALGQNVHAYREYGFDDIVYDARFADVISVSPDGLRELDFTRFHEVLPL